MSSAAGGPASADAPWWVGRVISTSNRKPAGKSILSLHEPLFNFTLIPALTHADNSKGPATTWLPFTEHACVRLTRSPSSWASSTSCVSGTVPLRVKEHHSCLTDGGSETQGSCWLSTAVLVRVRSEGYTQDITCQPMPSPCCSWALPSAPCPHPALPGVPQLRPQPTADAHDLPTSLLGSESEGNSLSPAPSPLPRP